MMIDGVDFNVKYWSSFSKDDFVKQCISEGLFNNLTANNQKALLEEVFDLIQYESHST
jgi:hypothetical protein